MSFIRTVILLFILSTIISAQEDKNFPALDSTDISEGKIRTSYYDGNALWGLIDGGADIFLEYGFDKLLFQEIEWKGFKFRVELYRMNDAEAAFGIFSVSRFKCEKSDTITKFICITRYQVQSASGIFYISITNDKGNREAGDLTLMLFSKMLLKMNEKSLALPLFFERTSFKPYKEKIKYLKGKLGIQNGFPNWIDLFDDYSNYEIYLLPVENEYGFAYIAQINFDAEKELLRFVAENQQKIKGKAVRTFKIVSSNTLILIESTFSKSKLNELFN